MLRDHHRVVRNKAESQASHMLSYHTLSGHCLQTRDINFPIPSKYTHMNHTLPHPPPLTGSCRVPVLAECSHSPPRPGTCTHHGHRTSSHFGDHSWAHIYHTGCWTDKDGEQLRCVLTHHSISEPFPTPHCHPTLLKQKIVQLHVQSVAVVGLWYRHFSLTSQNWTCMEYYGV